MKKIAKTFNIFSGILQIKITQWEFPEIFFGQFKKELILFPTAIKNLLANTNEKGFLFYK